MAQASSRYVNSRRFRPFSCIQSCTRSHGQTVQISHRSFCTSECASPHNENFNGRWQAKVWARFHHESLAALQDRSRRYVSAYRQRAAPRIDGAPQRRPFPTSWQPDLQARPEGVVIFIRRTSETGTVSLLDQYVPVKGFTPRLR